MNIARSLAEAETQLKTGVAVTGEIVGGDSALTEVKETITKEPLEAEADARRGAKAARKPETKTAPSEAAPETEADTASTEAAPEIEAANAKSNEAAT